MNVRKNPLDYSTMSLDSIRELPVSQVLSDEALLFCWTTNKYLADAIGLLSAWGVKYAFTMVWVKNAGPQAPNTPCFNAEYIVVGRKGNPRFLSTKAFKTANEWPRRGHSVKPEEFYELLRRTTPSPRLDIFSRRLIDGFDSWGNEVPTNQEEVIHGN